MKRPDGHFFAQDPEEFSELLQLVRGHESVLEIGSRYGESFRWFGNVTPVGSRMVTVDLGYCIDSGEESRRWWYNVCGQLAVTHDVHIIEGDSHDPKTVEKVTSLGPYDFIFFDGDHSEEGIKQDWENYGKLGKIVAFHDITIEPINRLYESIESKKKITLWNKPNGPGIGVLYR